MNAACKGATVKVKPSVLIIGVVAVVAVAALLPAFLTEQTGSRKVQGDTVTAVVANVETDSSVDVPVTLSEGDPEHEIGHIVDAMKVVPGVGSVAVAGSTLTVEYAKAQTDEAAIRQQLVSAGYVKASADDAVPAELAKDGKSQSIEVIDNNGFQPSVIRAKTGVPLEIKFGPGTECRTTVKIPDFQITQDITQGGTVKVPAMEPGTYKIACGGDGDEGVIFVE
jgi:hypothetical protein